MSADRLPFDEKFLKEKLKNDPTAWEIRRQLAHGLYYKQAYEEAAEIIWATEQIPSVDTDLAFAIRILAKAQPRRAIRLLTAVLELNQGKAVQNMAMANALLHHGMVLQAARFYGAALEADPALVNPDLEHFILWSDDECTMWGIFEKNRPKLGQLPWMLRDPKEALKLTSRISLHTTPISVPDLPVVPAEELKHDLYQQVAKFNAKITPPPAVTIPFDRVDPKDRLFDADYGAAVVGSAAPVDPEAPVSNVAAIPEAPVAAPPAPTMLAATLVPDGVVEETQEIQETQEPEPEPKFVISSPALLPSAAPTSIPTRSLLPSGPLPSTATGAPTRVLLPSGTPPAAGATRRLLVTPPLNTIPAPHTQSATPQDPKTTDTT